MTSPLFEPATRQAIERRVREVLNQQADFLSFVHDDGKGFIGIHSATITFTKWPEYGEMIGGYFD